VVQPARPKGRRRRAGADAARDGAVNAAGRLWGGRFAEPADALLQRYTASTDADARFVVEDVLASIAHARMLGRQRIIPRADASAIVRGLSEILEEHARGEFVLRPELEDVHTNVEARLREKIGAVAGRLHTARSRNDQVATDFRMYVKAACGRACAALVALQSSLLDLAETNRAAIMPGYTHLQRAQPVLFAHHLLAYVEMFARDHARFSFARMLMDESPLGSGALSGVPYPIDREMVAADLDFAGITANSIDAVSDRDFAVDFLSASALTMAHVSRLAEEIVLWSSSEFAFLRLPDAFATGSSIMPQKKNPDVAELARGRSGSATGALVALLTTLKGLPLAYNRDLQEDKLPVFQSEDALLETLGVLAAMLPRLSVDAKRMKRAAAQGYALATDLADYLVRKGMPFREAHEAVGRLVRYCEENGKGIERLALDELQRISPLFGKDAVGITVAASVRARDVPGGTAPRQVAAQIRRARRRLASLVNEGRRGTRRRPR
jgi:argininosuccinate lyase